MLGKVYEAKKKIFYGFPEDNLRGRTNLRKWRINVLNGRVEKGGEGIIKTMEKFGGVICTSGKWAAYAAADSLCQGIDAKHGISLPQERFIKRHESPVFPLPDFE